MRFLPVFLLAMMVQILAPVGACLATAIAASDPLAAAVLCQGAAAADHSPDQQPAHHMRDGSCAVCAAATPFSPPAPQPVPAEMSRHSYRVAWQAFAPDARAAKIATSAQARAPPVLS
jgi:hypothetical protein